jgi:hypothetical protein
MNKRFEFLAVARLMVASCALLAMSSPVFAAGKTHHLAIHVDQNDAQIMNLALNNAANVTQAYEKNGDTVIIEIVAYGPGLHMLRDDTSPVKDRLKNFKAGMPNVTFSACGVTRAGMAKAEGKEIPIVAEATVVPSGAVRLMELQEQGYSYVKP